MHKIILTLGSLLWVLWTPTRVEAQLAKGEVTRLPLKLRSPMRLSPDGQKVLMMRRLKKGGYGYEIYDMKTKLRRPLCDAPGLADDLFFFAFGRGMWAPDGKSFLMIQRASSTQKSGFGPTTLARCHLTRPAKISKLAVGPGSIRSGVFTSNGDIYFIRNEGTRRSPNAKLCKLKKGATKLSFCKPFPGPGMGLSRSPDGLSIGGLTYTKKGAHVWSYHTIKKKLSISRPFFTNDYLWKPLAYWSLDSRSLWINGSLKSPNKRAFSIFRYRPFAKSKQKRFQVYLKDRRYNTMGEVSPGVLLIFQRKKMLPVYFDPKTNKLTSPTLKGDKSQIIAILSRAGRRLLTLTGRRGVLLVDQPAP